MESIDTDIQILKEGIFWGIMIAVCAWLFIGYMCSLTFKKIKEIE